MKLAAWAERQFRELDQDGERTERIRLISADGGGVWQVWERKELQNPDDWAAEAESYLSELADEWPTKPVQVIFIAETAKGNERSQLPRTVRGKNRHASDSVMRGEPKAIADAMDSVSRTMGKVLESANVQIEVLTKTVRDQAEQTHALLEFIREMNTEQALAAQQNQTAITELMSGAKEYIPTVLNLLAEKMTRSNGKSTLPGVVKAASSLAEEKAKE
jgi:hypothetical protein